MSVYKKCEWCQGSCTAYIQFYQGRTYCSEEHFMFDRKYRYPFAFGELNEKEMATRAEPLVQASPPEVIVEEYWEEDEA